MKGGKTKWTNMSRHSNPS